MCLFIEISRRTPSIGIPLVELFRDTIEDLIMQVLKFFEAVVDKFRRLEQGLTTSRFLNNSKLLFRMENLSCFKCNSKLRTAGNFEIFEFQIWGGLKVSNTWKILEDRGSSLEGVECLESLDRLKSLENFDSNCFKNRTSFSSLAILFLDPII